MSVSSASRVLFIAAGIAAFLMPQTVAHAETLQADLMGESERVSGGGAFCQDIAGFGVGIATPSTELRVGGDSTDCDAEWGASIEFDLSGIPAQGTVTTATLRVEKVGQADQLPAVGVFGYDQPAAPYDLLRADMNAETALASLESSAIGTVLEFDVGAWVEGRRDAGDDRVGFFVAGLSSEIGFDNRMSIAGSGHASAPTLQLVFGGVPVDTLEWSSLKARYR